MARPFLLVQIRHVGCGGLFGTTAKGAPITDVFVCDGCGTEIEVQLVQMEGRRFAERAAPEGKRP